MKKFSLISMLVLSCFLFAGCSDDDSYQAPVLTLSSEEPIAFGTEGGTREITVKTDREVWKITSSRLWCKITQSDGKFTVTAEKNERAEVLKATITVTSGTGLDITEKTIDVSQAAAEKTEMTLSSSDPIGYTAEGGSTEITVTSNREWKAISNREWCKVVQGEGKFTITAELNRSKEAREPARVTVTAGVEPNMAQSVIEVTQQGFVLTPETTTVSLPIMGGSAKMNVESTRPFTADVPEGSWVTAVVKGSELTLSAGACPDEELATGRTETVTLTSEGVTTPITVTQYKPSYEAYLGAWTLTGYDSETVYNLTIEAAQAGSTYTVSGWSGSGIADVYPFEMMYDDASGMIAIVCEQNLGPYEDEEGVYEVKLSGMVPVGTQYSSVPGNYLALAGVLSGNTVEWMGYTLVIGGKEYPVYGICYFIEDQADGAYYNFNGDWPFLILPTMVKTDAKAQGIRPPMFDRTKTKAPVGVLSYAAEATLKWNGKR